MYDYDIDPQKDRSAYGGGSTAALVFKEIAENIMNDKFFSPIEGAIDHKNPTMPRIKRGIISDAEHLLSTIGIQDSLPKSEKGEQWGEVRLDKQGKPHVSARSVDTRIVPNVEGMGAKDAIYLMQKCGLNVVINGYGTVRLQSIPAGRRAIEGDTVRLRLQP